MKTIISVLYAHLVKRRNKKWGNGIGGVDLGEGQDFRLKGLWGRMMDEKVQRHMRGT